MFKPTILIDFDETITNCRGFGEPPNAEAIAAIEKLREKYKIVIYSCRANKNVTPMIEEVLLLEYLKKYDVFFDEICTRKPVFFALIDDRCYNPKTSSWGEIANLLLERANN